MTKNNLSLKKARAKARFFIIYKKITIIIFIFICYFLVKKVNYKN
ncbi:putative membrane protein [Acinetobacter sp. 21871]|nr:putative membrane protein [Acinetobacter sp. 21871]